MGNGDSGTAAALNERRFGAAADDRDLPDLIFLNRQNTVFIF